MAKLPCKEQETPSTLFSLYCQLTLWGVISQVDVKLHVDITNSFTNTSAGKPSLCHIAVPSNAISPHQKKTLQKSAVSNRYCVLFLLAHQAHVPLNKQNTHHCIARSTHIPQNVTTWLYWRKASIKTEPHWLCIYIILKTHCSNETQIRPTNAQKLDPVIRYILHSSSKKKRCNDKVNSRFLPFAQVWSQIPSNTRQLVVHKNKNIKLDF